MEPFKDKFGNTYYLVRDTLVVDLPQLKARRIIGKLTYNINKKTVNLIINRTSNQKTKFGYMVSWEPIKKLKPDKIILLEIDTSKVYYINYKETLFNKEKPWKFTPKYGYEEQIVLPDAHWNEIKVPIK